MHYEYQTTGTCSKKIEFDIENDSVRNIKFEGGCPGNLKILSKILDGWKKEEIIKMCKGNTCGLRKTSCIDQLVKALEEITEKEEQMA